MSITLGYKCNGATLGAGLAECLADAGDGHGVETTGDVSNGTTYVHCGKGWPSGSSANGDTSITGNGSTWESTSTNHSIVGYDATWLQFYSTNGNNDAIYSWHYWPVSPALTQADDFTIDFTFWIKGLGVTTDAQYLVVGAWGEVDADDLNMIFAQISRAAQYSRILVSDSTSYVSGNVAQTLNAGQYWCRLVHTAAARTWTIALYSDAFVTQIGATQTATWAVGKTFSVNRFGIRCWWTGITADYTKPATWKPITVTNVDFKRYSTASPTAVVSLAPGAGSLDPSTAELPVLVNGTIAAETSTRLLVATSTDGGGSYTAADEVADWKAAGAIAIDAVNGLLVRFTFVSDGAQHVQVNDGTLGEFTPTAASGGAYNPVGNSSVIGPARKVA